MSRSWIQSSDLAGYSFKDHRPSTWLETRQPGWRWRQPGGFHMAGLSGLQSLLNYPWESNHVKNQDPNLRASKASFLWLLAGTAAVIVLVALLGAWVGGENPVPQIDLVVTQAVQSVRSEALTAAMVFASLFGWTPWSWLVTAVAALLVGWKVNRRAGWLLGGTVALQFGLNLLVKELVQRPRPADPPAWVYRAEVGYSFVSGHVMEYVVLFGLLGLLLWRTMKPGVWRGLALLGAGLLIALVGVSRVYLGAHWLTDVAGGYLLGAVCLAWAARALEEAGKNLPTTALVDPDAVAASLAQDIEPPSTGVGLRST